MLKKLPERIAFCYRRARDSRERADNATDERARRDFLEMEARWLSLARSCDTGEQISTYLAEAERRSLEREGKSCPVSYSVRQEGSVWRWQILRYSIPVEEGTAASSVQARVAAIAAATRLMN